MRKYKNKKKRGKELPVDSRDKRAEIIIYVILIFLTSLAIVSGYMMSKEFEGYEEQENGHYKKTEKEK